MITAPLPPMRYRVVHQTTHEYHRNVTLSQQILHMTPRSFAYQEVESHRIRIEPDPPDWSNHTDYFGNKAKAFTLATPHRELTVVAESIVALKPRPGGADIAGSLAWETQRDYLRRPLDTQSMQPVEFLYESPHIICSAALMAYSAPCFAPGQPLLDACMALTRQIYQDFEFDDEATTISTPLDQVLQGRRGVCQDFAHLMLGCLRSHGLACRYVSGYILTNPPPGQARLVGADASHAWVSVFCDAHGWIDFDPTNCCLVGAEHITVGWGRDYSDVAPMRGVVLGGGGQELLVGVTVEPLLNQ